jgi:hypothetical protein
MKKKKKKKKKGNGCGGYILGRYARKNEIRLDSVWGKPVGNGKRKQEYY